MVSLQLLRPKPRVIHYERLGLNDRPIHLSESKEQTIDQMVITITKDKLTSRGLTGKESVSFRKISVRGVAASPAIMSMLDIKLTARFRGSQGDSIMDESYSPDVNTGAAGQDMFHVTGKFADVPVELRLFSGSETILRCIGFANASNAMLLEVFCIINILSWDSS